MDYSNFIKNAVDNVVKNHKFQYQCPNCKTTIEIAMKDDGSTLFCPNCNQKFKIEVN